MSAHTYILVHVCLTTLPAELSCNYVLLQIAVDSIENIRTVAALGIEENFFRQYKESVKSPYK